MKQIKNNNDFKKLKKGDLLLLKNLIYDKKIIMIILDFSFEENYVLAYDCVGGEVWKEELPNWKLINRQGEIFKL